MCTNGKTERVEGNHKSIRKAINPKKQPDSIPKKIYLFDPYGMGTNGVGRTLLGECRNA